MPLLRESSSSLQRSSAGRGRFLKWGRGDHRVSARLTRYQQNGDIVGLALSASSAHHQD